ncbi:MAG: IS200/IS605 family transposase [Muribaculaceae bacterium]|nr:IS200/IS605 family transposase [Muribaculaceae bacterium]
MSKTRSYFHIVFSTKFRIKCIAHDRKERLYQYITGTVKNKKSEMIQINGVEDHIHMLINLHPTVALADLVKAVKQSSSKRLQETHYLPLFDGWTSEYFACSVSPSHVDAVKEYICSQEEHHSHKDFVSEVTDFVHKMGMEVYQDEI